MGRPRVILLHGWTMRGCVFDGLIARLGDRLDCVAPDLPGHGASAHLPPNLDSAATMLSDLVVEDPRAPVVLGWSMGAAVAWRYIRDRGAGRLAGLVTVDMSPRMRPAAGWALGLRNQTDARITETTCRMKKDWNGSARAIAATMFAKGNDPRPFGRAEALAQILSEDPDILRAFWADLLTADARATVAQVTCPWLIGYGARSAVYGQDVAEWMQARAPDAHLLRLAKAGHAAHLEEPSAFADALTCFIRTL